MDAAEANLITSFDRRRMPSDHNWPALIALAEAYPVVRSGWEAILSPKGDRSAFQGHDR